MIDPLMHIAGAEQRNAHVNAISSGFVPRPMGMREIVCYRFSSPMRKGWVAGSRIVSV